MAREPKRGRKRPHLGSGQVQGMVIADPTGTAATVPYASVPGLIGAGNVNGPASATDNAIARFDGVTGKLIQNSLLIVQDDGRISTVTNPTLAQDAATKNYVDAAGVVLAAAIVAAGGHLHGLMRVLGDGATTVFNLLDLAEYLEHVAVNGAMVDPTTFTLSTDRSQITFDAAPGVGQVIALEYVIAGA